MGFDIECIIDIHTYPGEYFCPVCRTLVFPNEAFQSQCTHLYCKPCLAHIANGSRACPYDGYLVTESDSKPLMDSDKALSENIGKVKVHCLYFRSGCMWEGTLSDCTSHCLGCSFGNSPVICNKCGIQIVHRQVHDHAQSCPGVYDGQHAVGVVSSLTKSGTISSTSEVNQAASLSGAPPSQAQNPPNVTPTPFPGQNINPQASATSQAPIVAPVAGPTPEQMYQQQYQQYYQQYGGYDPYQQSNQQYYSIQQQPFQQYQQHPLQVLGQHQSHSYPQPQQSNSVPQVPQQHHNPQFQGQAQSQPQTTLPQVPIPPQRQAQLHAPMQALVPNYQVSSQQQAHPQMRPQTQIPPQTLPPPPQSQPTMPQPFSQAMGVRPPAQHLQVPPYQQPHVKMHHPHPSQSHVQSQMQSQAQAPQSSNQLHVQIQPQLQPYHIQPQHPVFSQANQPASALPQAPQQPVPPVGGHNSYLHSQPPQKMHPGASHQHLVHPQVASVALHPVQVHGEVPQQHPLMRPPSHGSVPNQHTSTLLASQNQVPAIHPAPHQIFPSHAPQPAYPQQHRPFMSPAQQVLPQNYAQPQHFHTPSQNQLHHQGHLTLQQSTQTQMRLPGPPPPHQSKKKTGRPMMPNQGTHSQNHFFLSGNCRAPAHHGPVQPTSAQPSVDKDYAESTVLEQKPTVQETRSLSKGLVEKVGEPLQEDVVSGQNGTVVKDKDINENVNKPIIKQDENLVQSATEQASGVKSFEDGAAEDEFREDGKMLEHSDSLKQVDLDNQKFKLSETAVTGPPSTFDKKFHPAVSSSGAEGHILPPHSDGSHQQRLQGPGIPPHPGALNSTEERVPGYFDPQGPAPTTLVDPRGIMERAPPLHFEDQYGPQHVGPSDILVSNNQISSSDHLSGEGGPFPRTNADELSMNGLTAGESSISGSRDEKRALPRELLNPFPKEPVRTLDQVSSSIHRAAPHVPIYDPASKLDPAAIGPHSRFFPHHPSGAHGHADGLGPVSEFGQHHMNHFSRRTPDRDYCGSPRGFGVPSSFPRVTSAFDGYNSMEASRFGEGSQSFNLPSDQVGNHFHDGRFPTMTDNLNGPGNPRFGEHRVPIPHHNLIQSDDVFGPDGQYHLIRGKYAGRGYLANRELGEFSGPGHAGEFSGTRSFPGLPFSEPIRGERLSVSHFGESPMNNYSHPGFPTVGNFSGGMDSFDQSRKRKLVSYGWCRICEIDCESLEGLDLHSQTREHQKMAMDVVKSIKMQNRKQQGTSAGRMLSEGGSRSRKVSIGGRGSKP